MALHEKLRRAREKRGLSHYAAAQRMPHVNQQQLLNLEHQPSATREPDPRKVTVQVVAEIVAAYWPDVQLEDFVPGLLRFMPRDSNAARRLKGYAATG